MKLPLISCLPVLFLVSPASARVWTDTTGRTIDAELVRMEGDKVILKLKGREVPLALDRLSLADREFLRNSEKPGPAAAVGGLVLCGSKLAADGGVTVVSEPLSAVALKAFSKSKPKPATLKIAIALPAAFDPAKPQRVMWVSAPINSEEERRKGNIEAMGNYAGTATAVGWVVIAADTDLGNPREEDNRNNGGTDQAVHANAVAALAAAWPGFKSWDFACCGFSGGAKATFYRAAQLMGEDLKVVGMFLGGCNQDMTAAAKDEVRVRSAAMKRVRVFISNGKSDEISTLAMAESVRDRVEKGGYGDVRLESYDGGHSLNTNHFEMALKSFAEPALK